MPATQVDSPPTIAVSARRLPALLSAGEPGFGAGREVHPIHPDRGCVGSSNFLSLAPSTACTQHVDAARGSRPLQCRPMGQTPIYDQLRREQTSTNAPVTRTDPYRAGHRGKNRLLTDRPDGVAAFHHDLGCPYPADAEQRGTVAWGPRAVLPPAAHARHTPPTLPTTSPPDGCRFGCQGARCECAAATPPALG